MYAVGDIVEWVGEPPDIGIVVDIDAYGVRVRWAGETEVISHAVSTQRVRKIECRPTRRPR